LTPGPAEALFGITAFPMAVIADWHGRVTKKNLRLRGDIAAACRLLETEHRQFDFRAARKPPYEVPDWAADMVHPDGEKAMLAWLKKVHPVKSSRKVARKKWEPLVEVYRSLDREGELLAFCANYIAACAQRAPEYGEEFPGYAEEVALLEEMTWCRNDRIKFNAIEGYGRFAPVANLRFFVERAKKRYEECDNPNVVLCRCLAGIALAVNRYPGPSDRDTIRDREVIMEVLPFPVTILDTEGRNNGACSDALDAIRAIAERAAAPEALEGYTHTFNPPTPDGEWLEDLTRKHHERNLEWLVRMTREDFGFDYEAWQRWYRENADELCYNAGKGRFVIDSRAAKAFRRKVSGR